jgi:23S rRNA (adenine2503-C2)-methyltransferase
VGRRRNSPARNLTPVKTTRYDLTRDDLAMMLEGEPRYRVDQIWTGLYEHKLAPEELSTLPKSLRSRLVEQLPPALAPVAESVSDDGDTVKWLWTLSDGASIETVLMHYRDRSTVCVSTQAGCAMACGFCATGQAGFERNLSVGEIVEQVVIAARRATEGTPSRRLSNVVFMGMGEPMANYDRVIGAVTRIHGDLGLSARHLTISTVGIIPGIRRLAAEPLPVNLAVSLHAANDTLRDELVPINRRYPIGDLVAACGDYLEAKNRRLSFEWALIGDVNDRDSDIRELAAIARDLRAHVNLIPLNATPGWPTVGSSPERVKVFCERLCDLGVNATVRANRGTEIDAACGQLRASHEIGKSASSEITLGATRRGTSDEA